MKRYLLLIAMLTVALSAFAAFGETGQQPVSAAAPAEAGHDHGAWQEKRFVATIGADGVQHVEITGGSYYFEPNYIVVKVNVPVVFTVKKVGYTPHDIVVKAPEAGINIDQSLERTPKTISFTPTKTGKYEMYCSKKLPFVKSHKERGMDGMIEVVP